MTTKSSSVMKYVGSAMAVGGTIMMGSAMLSSGASVKKKMKKTAGKALDILDAAISSAQNIVKCRAVRKPAVFADYIGNDSEERNLYEKIIYIYRRYRFDYFRLRMRKTDARAAKRAGYGYNGG